MRSTLAQLPGFLQRASRLVQTGASRSVVFTGNVDDLFPAPGAGGWRRLPEVLADHWGSRGRLVIAYRPGGALHFGDRAGKAKLAEAWTRWRAGAAEPGIPIPGVGAEDEGDFEALLRRAVGDPNAALELLWQCCCCSRQVLPDLHLAVVIEAAEFLLPAVPISTAREPDRRRRVLCRAWFGDPAFADGGDAVLLCAASASDLDPAILDLPQVARIPVPYPDRELRAAFVRDFAANRTRSGLPAVDLDRVAAGTAGLAARSLRQLLLDAIRDGGVLGEERIEAEVAGQVRARFGDGVADFNRPRRRLLNLVGNRALKRYLRQELVPRIAKDPAGTFVGATFCGPSGVGKRTVVEALAGELGMPLLELRDCRDAWSSRIDDRLAHFRDLIARLERVIVAVDDADLLFAGLASAEPGGRRLAEGIRALMHDPGLRGHACWMLTTSRIDRLPEPLRRPGEAGELVIPVLDPDGEDREEFVRWMLTPIWEDRPDVQIVKRIAALTADFGPAAYVGMRAELKARADADPATVLGKRAGLELLDDHLVPPVDDLRRYQALQALLHCTRKSLLPEQPTPDRRRQWEAEAGELGKRVKGEG